MTEKIDVLVVDDGGRGHAIVDKFRQSPRVGKIYCGPGNDGIGQDAEIVPLKPDQVIELIDFAREKKIGMTFVGTEEALAAGIGEVFRAAGLPIVAPTSSAALIETSKSYATDTICTKGFIPCPEYIAFDDEGEAVAYLNGNRGTRLLPPLVVKPDGLTGGKGVEKASTYVDACRAVKLIMGDRIYKESGDSILFQECLIGRECSSIAAVSTTRIDRKLVPVVKLIDIVADYKPLNDSNSGPNTGSMGGYGPFAVGSELRREITDVFLERAAQIMIEEHRVYEGILYAGLMLTAEGPKLLEYNARFGDPEAQIILPRMKTDLLELSLAIAEHRLQDFNIEVAQDEAMVCKVLAAKGYPTNPIKGKRIYGLEQAMEFPGVKIYHAGTKKGPDGYWYTNGGRVLNIVARARDFKMAKLLADSASACITFEDDTKHERSDIAAEVAV